MTESTEASVVRTGENETGTNTSSPNQQKAFTSFATSSVVAGEIYRFIDKWGGNNGDFNNPHAVALDSSGNAYVLDSGNNRVQKFDADGNFILQWGSAGSTDGKFNNPQGIAVDRSSGSVYVVDTGNNRVQKFGSTGSFLIKWGSKGSGNSQFNSPAGVAIDSSGNVYVSDVNNHRIAKFNSNGIFLTKWGSTGSGQGQFKGPHGVAVDSNNFVFVSDFMNNKVQKFTNIGQFVKSFGSSGSTDGKFNAPHGVAVDSDNNVYVSDRGNNRVQKFNNAGGFLTKFGTGGSGDGQFSSPDGIAVSSSGKVYVTDIGNKRVQVFAIDTTAPTAPTLLSPVNGATISNDKPAFDWTDVTDLTGVTYSLLVDNDNAFGSPEISNNGLTSSIFTPTTALSDTIYYWKVSAKDGAGNVGPFSSVFSFTIDKVAPTVTASPVGGLYNADQSVTLTSSEVNIIIYYTTDGSPPSTTSTQYSTAIPITTEGETILKFIGVDTAGNTAAERTEIYTIDKTAPTVIMYSA